MRFEGFLKSWNDERGFGFIEPVKGGDEIFVHIKALPARSGRPQVIQALSFEIACCPHCKLGRWHVVGLWIADRAALAAITPTGCRGAP